ncbi:hypothetical protein AB0759_41695 [Scytonema tolypothrichoides VB-61278_2]|uniref:Uncharacterized protein n=1 Tax=Scytonema tolypothrichoides VB-61278_2 TaxID=3232314 RepID=A0ABW8X1A5_9CYAN
MLKSNKVKTLKSLLHKNFEKREGSKVAKICSVRPAIASGSFEHPQPLATNESWVENLGGRAAIESSSRSQIFSFLEHPQPLATNESWVENLGGRQATGGSSRSQIFSIAKYKNFIPSNFAPKITNVDAETSNPLQIRKVPNASSNITNLQEKIADEIFETQDPPPIKKHPDSPPDVLVQIDTKILVLEQWRYDKLQAAIDDENLSEILGILEEIGVCGETAIQAIRAMQVGVKNAK